MKTKKQPCLNCYGRGHLNDARLTMTKNIPNTICPVCHGTGHIVIS